MSPKIPFDAQNHLLRFLPALTAFDNGDVDYARRSLIASFRHHTKRQLTATEEVSLLWCLAWFDFYEGCSNRAERLVRMILSIEKSSQKARPEKLVQAYYFIAMVCHRQGKSVDAQTNLELALAEIEVTRGKESKIYHAIANSFLKEG